MEFILQSLQVFWTERQQNSKKESIVSERKQEQYDSLLKQWKKDTKIKEEKKVWKKISFEEQGVTIKTSDTSDTSDSQN